MSNLSESCACVYIYIYTQFPRLFCNNFSAECVCSESNSKTSGTAGLCYDSSRAVFGRQYDRRCFSISLCRPHSYRTIDTAPVHSPRLICQWWHCRTRLGPTLSPPAFKAKKCSCCRSGNQRVRTIVASEGTDG